MTNLLSPRVYALHQAPLPRTVFVDERGDVWVPNGHNPAGELLLACPQPHDPEDAGVGEGFAWTYGLVQAAFGPLIGRSALEPRCPVCGGSFEDCTCTGVSR